MAKLDDIISQVMSELPKYTEDFCDVVNITNSSRSTKEITLTVDDDLISDTLANIKGVYAKLLVSSIEEGDDDGQWVLTTAIDHDQTYSESEQAAGIEKSVVFVGSFSGTKTLVEVTANNKITIESDTEPTGTFYLLEDRNYSGWKEVTIDNEAHTVKYSVAFEIDPYVVSGTVMNNIRVGCVGSEQDIVALLENEATQLTKKTIFVLMNGVIVSRDPSIFTDSKNRKATNDELWIEAAETFTLFAVLPTQTKATPREAINSIYTLRPYIVKCLHGALFESGFTESNKFISCYTGDAGESWNKSYYVHRFDFETIFNIGDDDAVPDVYSRAFRSFEIGIKLSFDSYEEVKKQIDGEIE
jgi:hypothetical protein